MTLARTAALIALVALAAAFPTAGARAQEASESPAPSASASPPAIPSPVPTADDPRVHKLAVQQFLAWQQGQIDRTLYSDDVNGQLTDDVVTTASRTLANLGALQNTTFRGISHAPQGDLYVYHMACDRGAVDMDFSIDPKGKIFRIYFN